MPTAVRFDISKKIKVNREGNKKKLILLTYNIFYINHNIFSKIQIK